MKLNLSIRRSLYNLVNFMKIVLSEKTNDVLSELFVLLTFFPPTFDSLTTCFTNQSGLSTDHSNLFI